MEINTKIKKKQQEIARLERNLALDKIKKRKSETRRKIELGGLVIKAKMDKYPKDIILGALLSAAAELKNNEGAKLLYQSLGKAEFLEYGNYDNDKYKTDAD